MPLSASNPRLRTSRLSSIPRPPLSPGRNLYVSFAVSPTLIFRPSARWDLTVISLCGVEVLARSLSALFSTMLSPSNACWIPLKFRIKGLVTPKFVCDGASLKVLLLVNSFRPMEKL